MSMSKYQMYSNIVTIKESKLRKIGYNYALIVELFFPRILLAA